MKSNKNLTQQQKDIISRISFLVGKLHGSKIDHGWCEFGVYNKGKTITIKSYSDAGVFKTKIQTIESDE